MTRNSKLFKNKIKHMHNLDASMNKNKKCIKVEIIKSCKVHKYIYIYMYIQCTCISLHIHGVSARIIYTFIHLYLAEEKLKLSICLYTNY